MHYMLVATEIATEGHLL